MAQTSWTLAAVKPTAGMKEWHHRLHQITGAMALNFMLRREPKKTLRQWAAELEQLAQELKAAARRKKP